jgi:hypothetical protein
MYALRLPVDREGNPVDMNVTEEFIKHVRKSVVNQFTNQRKPMTPVHPNPIRNSSSTLAERNTTAVMKAGKDFYSAGYQELQCHDFTPRTHFPDNVVMLKDGRVLFCASFIVDGYGDVIVKGTTSSGTKNLFRTKRFSEHGDSRHVGYHEVSPSDIVAGEAYVPWTSVKSKCAIFPFDILTPDGELLLPTEGKRVLRFDECASWFIVEMIH